MKNVSIKLIFIGFILILCSNKSYGQVNIFEVMENKSLKLEEVEKIADKYFLQVGTGRGTGYKQYQRWWYERKFHIDEKGNYINPSTENDFYSQFLKTQKFYKASSVWKEMGPYAKNPTSSWNPGVGRITSVAIHPSDTTVIYVSSPGGGIWKSTNSGSSWTPLIDYVNSGWMNVYNLCIDPSNTNTIYAAPSGVIKSNDAGKTWNNTGSGPSSVKKILVHPSNSNIVFATGSGGIWRSVNAGTSWTKVSSVSSMEDIEFNPYNVNVMYASGSGSTSILRSKDNGINWTSLNSSNGIEASGRTLLGVSPDNPAIVYAAQASGSIFGRFYKSTDTGYTYKVLIKGSATNGTNFFGYEPNGKGTTGQASYDMAMCVNPKDVDEIHIAGIICWKSIDGGDSFTAETVWSYPNSVGYNHADVHSLEWINSTIYSTSDGGIYKSTNNGGDWTDLTNGIGIRQFYRISCSKTDPEIISGGAQDNGTSYRQSNGDWIDWLGADGMDCVISPTNSEIAIGTSQNGGIYKTTNAGKSRIGLSQPSSGNWITPLAMHPFSHDTVFGGWTGIWKSVNGGTNWSNLTTFIKSKMNTLAVAQNPNYIYGSVYTKLYRTVNGGKNWDSTIVSSEITSIYISKKDPKKLWITCNSSSNRVFISTDGGANFTNISSGLPSVSARSVVVDENDSEDVYVGMNIGVYQRSKNNSKWNQYGTGLPLVAINEIEIQEKSGKLRVATYGRGLWECDLRSKIDCAKPWGLNSTVIGLKKAKLVWNNTTTAQSYTVEYKTSAASSWSVISDLNDTTVLIESLTPGEKYYWRVRSNCPTWGDFSLDSFQTPEACKIIDAVIVDSITINSAIINWSNVNSLSYIVEYKEVNSSTWISLGNVTQNRLVLSGLKGFTEYDLRIKSICTYDSSNFYNTTFITESCSMGTGLLTRNLGSNSVTLYWDKVFGANEYHVEYKKAISSVWDKKINTIDTFLNISNLEQFTDYDWMLQPLCSNAETYSTFKTKKGSEIGEHIPSNSYLIINPVPAGDFIKFSFFINKDMKNIGVDVIDLLGKKLISKNIDCKNGKVSETLNTEQLANGIYFLILKTQNSVYVQKFIIEK
ncbi:MAG: T9SS type A sorting domain-containing protein [Bacteroidetes bacterium]|nr:T9SS type A sorting domain-containing protein [Bacteroidota bacterium]